MKTLLNRWKLENQANQNGVKVMDDVKSRVHVTGVAIVLGCCLVESVTNLLTRTLFWVTQHNGCCSKSRRII